MTDLSKKLKYRGQLLKDTGLFTADDVGHRLVGTNYRCYVVVFPSNYLRWMEIDTNKVLSFEKILDEVSPELRTRLLFHLDLFAGDKNARKN